MKLSDRFIKCNSDDEEESFFSKSVAYVVPFSTKFFVLHEDSISAAHAVSETL